MEANRNKTRKILRKGRAALELEIRISPIIEVMSGGTLYNSYVGRLEEWVSNILLPQMDTAIGNAPRKSRLYTVLPKLEWVCDGKLVEDRWLSVRATLIGSSPECPIDCRDFRVWDVRTGRLCPIEWFLPRKDAAGYERWSFQIDGQTVYGFPKGRRKNGSDRMPIEVGKIKYRRLPS